MQTVEALWAELPESYLSDRLQSFARSVFSIQPQHRGLASREQEVSSDMIPHSPATVKAAVQEVEPGTFDGLASLPGADLNAHGWDHTTTVDLLRPSSASMHQSGIHASRWHPRIRVVGTRQSALRWHVHYEGSLFQPPRAEQLELCLNSCY